MISIYYHNTIYPVRKEKAVVPTLAKNIPFIFIKRFRKMNMLQNFPIGKICMVNNVQKLQSNRTINYIKNNN